MVNLAANGVVCECGAKRLAPQGDLEPGALVICAACAGVFRVVLALAPVRWSIVEHELAALPHDLLAFEWYRNGVPLERRRTLAELAATGGRYRAAERSGAALAVAFFLLAALVVLKAVWS